MILLLSLVALSQDNQTSWELLQDAQLIESLEGELDVAVAEYEDLARHLGPDDPVHSEALYQLGDAYYRQGRDVQARRSLRECVRIGTVRSRCLELLGQIELDAGAVTNVPTRWSFDEGTHGVVHPWRFADRGSIRIHSPDDGSDPVLAWRTQVDARTADQLVIGFRDVSPPPRGIRFLVASTGLDASLRVVIHDIDGYTYVASKNDGVFSIPRGGVEIVRVSTGALRVEDGPARTLDPSRIDRVVIQDVSAFYASTTGVNELLLDDFEVY